MIPLPTNPTHWRVAQTALDIGSVNVVDIARHADMLFRVVRQSILEMGEYWWWVDTEIYGRVG